MSIARSLSMLMVEFFYLANLAFYFTHFVDQVVALQRDLDEGISIEVLPMLEIIIIKKFSC